MKEKDTGFVPVSFYSTQFCNYKGYAPFRPASGPE
jgi:hypothetical protein